MAKDEPNYRKKAVATITFNPNKNPAISVNDSQLAVAANGTLQWKCSGNVDSFRVVMKDTSRTPFQNGSSETGGVTETPEEAVDQNAYHGPSDPKKNTYSYAIYCTGKDGNEHELDPEVVVGPPDIG